MNYSQQTEKLLVGLYPPEIVAWTARLVQHYADVKQGKPAYIDVPSSLHHLTEARRMSDPVVEAPPGNINRFFRAMGIYQKEDKTITGPLNHILARMLTIPRMIEDYIGNYPSGEERKIYTDPPLLKLPPDHLRRMFDDCFAGAASGLKDRNEFVKRLKLLGQLAETVAEEVESVYPATNSTQAYETFGVFHIMHSNRTVDITATSPGVILPTEADPLRYRDSIPALTKNLLRPTYFEMLRLSVELAEDRIRRYSASRSGTAKNLMAYRQLIGAAKEILGEYLDLGNRFEIRLCEQDETMKLATLIGDIGVVYSVRDPDQKGKIAHNITVIDPIEARRHRETFESQWANGEPIKSEDVIDRLVTEFEK